MVHHERILSSLPLQMLLFFHGRYTWLWFFLNLMIFCWKSYKLYYTSSAIRWELALVFLLPVMDMCRNKLATRGNKTEQVAPLVWSMVLAALAVAGYTFFLEWQTYVLHIDRWLNGIPLTFISLELVFSLFALLVFRMAYQF